jgi:simple sugar transport system ATP-binding protein
MAPDHELLKVDGVSKAFPGVLANDGITFSLRKGEIHALIGENGAGKTTLVGILYGLHHPDAGRILIDGEEIKPGDPREAIARGLGFVQQHYSLVPTLTVIENLILSSHYGGGRSLSRDKINERIAEMSRRYGLRVDSAAKVERLSVSEQQHVELVKTLIETPRILILDEPTALLSAEEVQKLWAILRELAKQGVGVLLIGHKLEDVLAIADRITVLRQGRVVATVQAAEVDALQLGAMMVGNLCEQARPDQTSISVSDTIVLELRHLSVSSDRSRNLKDITLSVKRGEILGIAGVIGSGQVELLEAIMGIRPSENGTVLLHGDSVSSLSTRERYARGMAFVPGDRHRDGLVGPMSVADNLALNSKGRPAVSRFGILNLNCIESRAHDLMSRFGIHAAGPKVAAITLSGGNQQKVILARELSRDPEVVLCCYPTRGLDFAATATVHEDIRSAARRGAAVIVVSIDLSELVALAKRLVVIQAGRIIGEVLANQVTAAELGLMLGGGIAA